MLCHLLYIAKQPKWRAAHLDVQGDRLTRQCLHLTDSKHEHCAVGCKFQAAVHSRGSASQPKGTLS